MLNNLLSRGAIALCVSSMLASTALAGGTQSISDSDSIVLQPTNWSGNLTVNKFNVAGATLIAIDFDLAGNAQGSASIENLDAQPATISTSFAATITMTRPDLSVLAIALPVANFSDNLAAFDGTIDFAGPSGTAHLGIVANGADSINTIAPADLALFSGPGTISLPCDAAGSSTASGAGNLITQFNTDAEASVVVTYHYIIDCNGNGIDDAQDIIDGAYDWNNNGIPDECEPDIWRFCIGDGEQDADSVQCPCGNNDANNLGGCLNVLGLSGTLSATGTPSIMADTLQLTVTGIPHRSPGWFFMSSNAQGPLTPAEVVLGNGKACLTNPTRVLKLPGGTGGGLLPEAGGDPLSVTYGIMPGQTTFWQFYYRDANGACGGHANASNAVGVTWGL